MLDANAKHILNVFEYISNPVFPQSQCYFHHVIWQKARFSLSPPRNIYVVWWPDCLYLQEKQYSNLIRNSALKSNCSRFKFHLCYFQVEYIWAWTLNILCLCTPNCKIGIRRVSASLAVMGHMSWCIKEL